MRRLALLLVLLLPAPILWASTQSINPVPSFTSPPNNWGTQVQTFLQDEDAARTSRQMTGFVYSGGLATISGTLSHTISAVDALGIDGHYIQVNDNVHLYTASRETYVFLDSLGSRSPEITASGGSGCTFQSRSGSPGTREVFIECASGSTIPTLSVSLLPLLQVTTGAAAITTVVEWAPLRVGTAITVDTPRTLAGPVQILGGSFVKSGNGSLVIRGAFEAPRKQQVFVNFSGVTDLTFSQGAIEYLRPEWFGVIPDGVTSGVAGWNVTFYAAFASSVSTVRLSQGLYYLATPVTVNNREQNLRLVCDSMARWPVVPEQCRITGANGIESLFIFASDFWALEVDHISFEGNSPTTGVVSAIKSTGGGGPPRPVNVHHSTFRGFSRALHNAVSYGFGSLTVKYNTFLGNDCALWSTGLNGVTNMDWSNNVSEQGGKICSGSGTTGYGGTINITDNLMEGQTDAIVILCGLCQATIARNYFETNSGYILSFTAVSNGSSLMLGPNFYTNSANARILVNNVYFENRENLPSNIYLSMTSTLSRSAVGQPFNYVDTTTVAGFQNSMAPAIGAALQEAPLNIGTSLSYGVILATGNSEQTPLGMRRVDTATTGTSIYSVPIADVGGSVVANDFVVVTALVSGGSATWLNVLIRDNTNAVIAQLGTNAFLPFVRGRNEWVLIHVGLRVSGSSAGDLRVSMATDTGLTFRVADFTMYNAGVVTTTSKLPLAIRSLEAMGSGTLLAGNTSVTITHGLSIVPRTILAIPQGNVGYFWVDTITATQFTFNVSAAPGVAVPLSWRVN